MVSQFDPPSLRQQRQQASRVESLFKSDARQNLHEAQSRRQSIGLVVPSSRSPRQWWRNSRPDDSSLEYPRFEHGQHQLRGHRFSGVHTGLV